MEPKQIDLYEFLVESELQQYYNSIKNELKIQNALHLKYASDEDLKQIGMTRPEVRRLRKFYEKYYPHGYLSKIKRLLQNPKKDDNHAVYITNTEPVKYDNSPIKIPNNKHIIPADSICVNKELGIGEFGIVQQGVWTNGAERIQVAIKCLCRERMQSNPMEFLKEAAIMHAIDHENIVRLYGVVLDTDSLMLVTELAHLRSLLECLKDSGLRVSFLTIPTLCEFAIQICNGMMYLENKRLIHRDLAARNILVFSKNKVKISDFGLSRALGVGKDYYKSNLNVNLKLPISWCAPECINYLRFTNASDVWAYAVCLWEMFSYGFHPWAALTGQQILEAIDEPNYQRLEQPDCCPREYYTLMLKCWQHDPNKRPKFNEIYLTLPDMKPEQLKTIASNSDIKKDHLMYRQGEIITVLDKTNNSPYWKGVLNSGKTGLFNPANTVAFLEGLPSTNNRDSFCRMSDRSSKRKLRTEMISMPQNDLKHTGHVGLDGAYFGDVAFLASSQNYNHLPRQIVTPYKPSEDIEQTPLLLPPTPTSPDSLQTASGYFLESSTTSSTNPSFVNSNENTPKQQANIFGSAFDFPSQTNFTASNPFLINNECPQNIGLQNNDYGLEANAFNNMTIDDRSLQVTDINKSLNWAGNTAESQHEYHEISDDEIPTDKVFDLGPSLLEEISSMFGSMGSTQIESVPKSSDFDHTNIKNEMTELVSKISKKNNTGESSNNKTIKKKNSGIVKPISVKEEKILNQAIEIANEISARSMTDLVLDHNNVTVSPKRKFSFRFPNLAHHNTGDKDNITTISSHSNALSNSKERKNFTEELKNIPDLQNSITEEHKEAYNSLIEKKPIKIVGKFETNEFDLVTAKTLPRKFISYNNTYKTIIQKQEVLPPQNQAPRPTTLPNRGFSKLKKSDLNETNPLRVLRDKNYPIVRTRNKHLIKLSSDKNINPAKTYSEVSDKESFCESPSYLTNSSYNFPMPESVSSDKTDDSSNPIPLPPRDRTKPIQTSAKRHVRKHPLIIPASGVQRTLDKVTAKTTTNLPLRKLSNEFSNHSKKSLDTTTPCIIKVMQNKNFSWKNQEKTYNNHEHKLYENVTDLQPSYYNENNIDTASLCFESIMENNFNKTDIVGSPDVIDGFCPFSIQKDLYNKSSEVNFNDTNISGLYVNEDELRNLDIKKTKIQHLQKTNKYKHEENELAGNVLFNKRKESVELAINQKLNLQNKTNIDEVSSTAETNNIQDAVLHNKIKDANSVSCEDLLEFSDKKPKGVERGVDSDEVRIMLKVLGKEVSPTRCLDTLDKIAWDVHKGIKLIKLQNILSGVDLTFEESLQALQKYDWDLHLTTLKLKGLQ